MYDEQQNIRNALLLGGGLAWGPSNSPRQYGNQQKQYYGSETAAFADIYGKYASDTVEALAQGLAPEDPIAWETVTVRLADMVKPSATTSRQPDDYKMLMVVERDITYIPPGAKFVTMGSTWLCIAPENISGVFASGMVEKCNAVWKYLDYYGNLREEPMAVTNSLIRASSPDPQGMMLITKGYYDVKCQNNAATQQLNDNSRIMLGTAAYCITGFSDANQEFTSDENGVRLLEFTLRYEEPNPEIDDLENRVAGGKEFSWEIAVTGLPVMAAGQKAVFAADSVRCGRHVTGTETCPITYQWSSTNPAVATVDESTGEVTAVGEGTCQIVCILAENLDITSAYTVAVEDTAAGKAVSFLTTPPASLNAYESTTFACGCFAGGQEVPGGTVTWSFAGPAVSSYQAETMENQATITCWGGDDIPLTVTASWEGAQVTAEIRLYGM